MEHVSPGGPTPDVIRQIAKMVREGEARAAARQKRFGHTGIPNTVELADRRAVCVGGQIRFVDPRWAPLNFMARLLVETLGESWFGRQLETAADPTRTPHPIISWYRDTMAWQSRHADTEGHVRGFVSGPARAWFLLAYDVWVLSHHALLQPLVPRLRDIRYFQGRRYELDTYALFVRGGFVRERQGCRRSEWCGRTALSDRGGELDSQPNLGS
jgi:hypothetical protein